MGGLSEAEKKKKISDRLNESYNKYKLSCSSRLELENKIDGDFTAEENQYKDEDNIKLYYLENKKKILDDYYDTQLKEAQKKEAELNEKLIKNMLEQQKALQELQKQASQEQQQRQKEQNEAIQNLINEHNKNIESMRNEALQQQRRYEEQQRRAEKESRQLLEQFEKKYKEERDEEKKKQILEEKKKMEELEKKKKELKKKFDERIKEIKEDKIKEIINSFKLTEEKFCLEEISKFDNKKINELIINLFKNEKILKNILFNLNIFIEKIKDKIRNVEHLNTILVGPSGVGKSTLINSILELETQTVTGFGQPQTQNIEFHSSPKIPFLRLADSKGIEKNETAGIDAIYKSIKDFIQKQLGTKNPDNFIHCIWYCWTGARLEDSEIEILRKLSAEYSLETLPVIIIYTNAIDPIQVNEAKKYISCKLGIKNSFVEVLAAEKQIRVGEQIMKIPPYNLDKLKEISIKLAMSAVNSSCYEGLTTEIKDMIKETINNLTEELKLKINYDVKTIISKMNEKSEFEDLYKENINIILDIFYKFIFLNPDIKIADYKKPEVNFGGNKYMISMQSQAIIKDFVIDYFKESLSSYEKNLNVLLSNHTKELCNEIISFQMEFNQQNDNLLKTPWTSIELGKIIKKYLHDNLAEKAKLANLKNSFSYISSPIIQKFGEYFISSYNKGMTRPEFIKKANDVIKIPFNKIEKQIKDYNEMLKKKKLEDSQEMAPTPLGQNQTTQKPTPESTPEKDLEGLSWND